MKGGGNTIKPVIDAAKKAEYSQWGLADALLRYCGEPGEAGANNNSEEKIARCAEALENVGINYKPTTLRLYRDTAFHFPFKARQAGLSFTVHRVVGNPDLLKQIRERASQMQEKLTVALALDLKAELTAEPEPEAEPVTQVTAAPEPDAPAAEAEGEPEPLEEEAEEPEEPEEEEAEGVEEDEPELAVEEAEEAEPEEEEEEPARPKPTPLDVTVALETELGANAETVLICILRAMSRRKDELGALPAIKRRAHVHGVLAALGLTVDDLRPIT